MISQCQILSWYSFWVGNFCHVTQLSIMSLGFKINQYNITTHIIISVYMCECMLIVHYQWCSECRNSAVENNFMCSMFCFACLELHFSQETLCYFHVQIITRLKYINIMSAILCKTDFLKMIGIGTYQILWCMSIAYSHENKSNIIQTKY